MSTRKVEVYQNGRFEFEEFRNLRDGQVFRLIDRYIGMGHENPAYHQEGGQTHFVAIGDAREIQSSKFNQIMPGLNLTPREWCVSFYPIEWGKNKTVTEVV